MSAASVPVFPLKTTPLKPAAALPAPAVEAVTPVEQRIAAAPDSPVAAEASASAADGIPAAPAALPSADQTAVSRLRPDDADPVTPADHETAAAEHLRGPAASAVDPLAVA
jgi:hypothetical protein